MGKMNEQQLPGCYSRSTNSISSSWLTHSRKNIVVQGAIASDPTNELAKSNPRKGPGNYLRPPRGGRSQPPNIYDNVLYQINKKSRNCMSHTLPDGTMQIGNARAMATGIAYTLNAESHMQRQWREGCWKGPSLRWSMTASCSWPC